MSVSIIVCTQNRAEHLAQSLTSLSEPCLPEAAPVELLVVDNASTDDTPHVVQSFRSRYSRIRYLRETRPGKCYGLNAGIAASSGEILLFADDDVRFPPRWVESMTAPILTGRAHAVQGGVRIAPHLERPWMQPLHRTLLASTEMMSAAKPDQLIGANMAISRCILEKVPGFDTELGPGRLGFMDDTLFGRQIIQAGFTIASALDVVVEHHPDGGRLSRSSFLDRARKQGRSSGYVAYHWEHRNLPPIRPHIIKQRIRLAKWRFLRRSEIAQPEGIPPWEYEIIHHIACYERLLADCGSPRKYAPRGLCKLPV